MRLELAPGELSWRQLELQLRVDQCPAPDCPFHFLGTGPAAGGSTYTSTCRESLYSSSLKGPQTV